MTFTPLADRLAVELSLPVLGLSRLGFEHPTFRLRGERSNPLHHHHYELTMLKSKHLCMVLDKFVLIFYGDTSFYCWFTLDILHMQ